MTDPRRAIGGATSLTITLFLILVAVLGLVAAVPDVKAQGVDPFTVEDVPIDATAKDARAARRKALAQGQEKAFGLLLRRLAHTSEHGRLPKPTSADIDALVDGISVRRERSSKVRYLALLTVRFKADRIRSILKIAGINYVDTPSRPVVVVPLYKSGNKLVLWEGANPWRAAWNKVPLKGGLVPFVLALGDLGDVQSINADQALKRDRKSLEVFAGRYSAGQVLIALAEETGGSAEHPTLVVRLWRFDAFTRRVRPAGRRGAVKAENRDGTFLATATAVARAIEQQWKIENQASIGGDPSELRVRVPIESLGQWTDIHDRVKRVRVVKGTRVLRLSRERAILAISYVGDIKRLSNGLAQQNIALVALAGAGNGGGATNGATTNGGTSGNGGGATGEPTYELRLGGGVVTGNGDEKPAPKTNQ
ncbi:MAG: DUF2066 domain-containing protein [Alphaproteobacteria bacterium]|nr:DUF2066 domain-containing protein [Alphaproteobacteria bacterium]